MNKDSSIFVSGHRGLVGSAVCRALRSEGYFRVLTVDRAKCNLLVQAEVDEYFHKAMPEYVIHCAAKVGGIVFHRDNPIAALSDNLKIAENVIHAAANTDVKKLLFLASACAYPKMAETPIREDSLLTGALEPSNEGYALAKIVGIKLCEAYKKQQGRNFIACMPTNIYGPGDHYDLQNSHVLPGMMRRLHEAKLSGSTQVELWGTGHPTREFLHCGDLAQACIFLMNNYDGTECLNVGTNCPMPLWLLANQIIAVTEYAGSILWNHNKPDGTPRRSLDSSKIFELGWRPAIPFSVGLEQTYADFLSRYPNV
jgi:GDP-L-fucose synthase